MDFRTELSKWGYNKGNSIDVETLIDEILPSLFSQQEISNREEDLREAFKQSRQALIFEKDMPPIYENFEEFFEQFKKK